MEGVGQQKRKRLQHRTWNRTPVQLKTPGTHVESPHELSLGNTEAGSDSDSASEAMEFGAEAFTDTVMASAPAQLSEGIRRSKRNTQSQVPLHMRGQMRYRLEEVAATQRSHQE